MKVDCLGWSDPVGQLLALQVAMKQLRAQNGRAARLEAATFPLCKYQPSEFPERIRQHVLNILEARDAVRRDYRGDSLFHFGMLGRRGCLAIEEGIEALFAACLIDIGRMSASAGPESEYADIVYPGAGEPLELRRA